jgi:hypothetical protein
MTRRGYGALLALGVAACSNLTAGDEGVATLVLYLPHPREVEVGQTLELRGEVLDGDGNPLAVPLVWRALDTIVDVDSTRGLLTGRVTGKTGQVAARAGNLYTRPVTFTVIARADTLIRVAPAELTVAAAEEASADLEVRLEGGEPLVPVANRRVVYQVVDPVFPSDDDRTIELSNGALVASAVTSSTGMPFPAIQLRRRTGRQAPEAAVITLSAYRPGGEAIPGSGQQLTVRFLPP